MPPLLPYKLQHGSFLGHCCVPGGGDLVAKVCPTLVTLWTEVHQAPLSMGFSRQEYWSGLPFPPPGDLPDLGIEPGSPAVQADSSPTAVSLELGRVSENGD